MTSKVNTSPSMGIPLFVRHWDHRFEHLSLLANPQFHTIHSLLFESFGCSESIHFLSTSNNRRGSQFQNLECWNALGIQSNFRRFWLDDLLCSNFQLFHSLLPFVCAGAGGFSAVHDGSPPNILESLTVEWSNSCWQVILDLRRAGILLDLQVFGEVRGQSDFLWIWDPTAFQQIVSAFFVFAPFVRPDVLCGSNPMAVFDSPHKWSFFTCFCNPPLLKKTLSLFFGEGCSWGEERLQSISAAECDKFMVLCDLLWLCFGKVASSPTDTCRYDNIQPWPFLVISATNHQ